jgi:hypothetical protein
MVVTNYTGLYYYNNTALLLLLGPPKKDNYLDNKSGILYVFM